MRKRLVVGNWKMYIGSREEAREFALGLRRKIRGLSGVDIYIAPPHPFIPEVAEVLQSSSIRVGAQTLSAHEDGQHTGEVSSAMLKSVGALFSIIGHSERRGAGDTKEAVHLELKRAIEAGLIPILCVGEWEREINGEHFSFIDDQLSSALRDIPKNLLKKLIVAYEPVWAIGKEAKGAIGPGDLEEMTIFIRKQLAELIGRPEALRVPVLYGGSVDTTNASNLITEGGVNGFLVGRASAGLDSFLEIIKATQN